MPGLGCALMHKDGEVPCAYIENTIQGVHVELRSEHVTSAHGGREGTCTRRGYLSKVSTWNSVVSTTVPLCYQGKESDIFNTLSPIQPEVGLNVVLFEEILLLRKP